MDEEFQFMHLLNTILNIIDATNRKSIQKDHLHRLLRRADPEIIKQLVLSFAENLHFEVHSDLANDARMARHWGKILSSPIEELPTLMGVREDLDELIEERLKA